MNKPEYELVKIISRSTNKIVAQLRDKETGSLVQRTRTFFEDGSWETVDEAVSESDV